MHGREFWLERWQLGQTGFHQQEVLPLLQKHWPALQLPKEGRVLVPLCGKTLDMHWLAAQGHRVLGVELSPLAVTQFFDEAGPQPQRHISAAGEHFIAGPIEIICCDAFALDANVLADCTAVYDRAALIALPADLRQRYLQTVYAQVPTPCRGLLITLEYPQAEKAGPPFSMGATEVHALFDAAWQVDQLENRDILNQEPRFRAEGVTGLSTVVYRLQRTERSGRTLHGD
ncbi:thiopurine S-methyltransferase [Xanthomonas vasicola]|uniref:Thiopurine S-methyltransferase n=1 Tax=Xanthomonas vasicola pv. vasculorum NCPPB 890 TaxID=1184265 RepID=A0A836NZK3_XANVA|nr:thiopurine S-methyltransferase [Xanthomonas vasicola]KFA29781.1 thiopurine S-methyltransferase [Xanthomonas vasicola pv. vasculorum NCPPB 1381]KFA37473.1 thiopurine S-methyltransferase [Xanthomonas vasicola pv. vasculorum NCPPB 206]MBV6745575.1 thiopurine S-methyltransferase [Xanthomonas vasicola pv. vasculorum NCPPB 890]MBV6891152.1 thiopurine S-methyltransferase [Xanthomonas vasicola pv. vasculorum]MDO6947267.1 thiopurine S-methyltransferase [Xanthomonas vasicola]